ncbi:MAG: hypothetical protein RLO06_15095 [Parvibaculum sp.]|jgi:hypothetical protein
MYLTLQVDGAAPDEIVTGMLAAQAVFDKAGITPLEAAEARFEVELWDITYAKEVTVDPDNVEARTERAVDPDESEISEDDAECLVLCTVWDEAEEAAIEACCASWGDGRRPGYANLRLIEAPLKEDPEAVTEPAPATRNRNLERAIADEICTALNLLDGPSGLLRIVGSWRDGEDDNAVLAELRAMNGRGPMSSPSRDPKRAIARELSVAMTLANVPAGLPGDIGARFDGKDDADVLGELRVSNSRRVEKRAPAP